MGSVPSNISKSNSDNLDKQDFVENYITSRDKYLNKRIQIKQQYEDGNRNIVTLPSYSSIDYGSSNNGYGLNVNESEEILDQPNLNSIENINLCYSFISPDYECTTVHDQDLSKKRENEIINIAKNKNSLKYNNNEFVDRTVGLHETSIMDNNINKDNILTQKKLRRSKSSRSWQFSKESLSSDTKKPVVVRHDSARFHQSAATVIKPYTSMTLPHVSAQFSFTSSLPESDLKKMKHSGVNIDFLQQSKSKLQRSFRNLKFYARNLTPEREETESLSEASQSGSNNLSEIQKCKSSRSPNVADSKRKFSTFHVKRYDVVSSPEPLRTLNIPTEEDSLAILDKVISEEQKKESLPGQSVLNYPTIQKSHHVAKYLLEDSSYVLRSIGSDGNNSNNTTNSQSPHSEETDSAFSFNSNVNFDTDSLSTDTDKKLSLSFTSFPSKQMDSGNAGDIDNFSGQTVSFSGQIRKTGWLIMKHILVPKKCKVELASKRQWRKYWVNLKDCQLMFFDVDSKYSSLDTPKIQLDTRDALIQAVPEHAKKEHVFCLSMNNGNAFLLQANSGNDVENWIRALNSDCCIKQTLIQKDGVKNITKKKLEDNIEEKILFRKKEIEMDEKMKKMAELQLTLVSEANGRKAILDQIGQWENNLERNHVHVYRLRCYLNSLQRKEVPSSHQAMSSACKTSKQLLSGLKLFNISSLHALVNAKQMQIITSNSTKMPRKKSSLLTKPIVKRSGSFNGSLLKEKKNDFNLSLNSGSTDGTINSPIKSTKIMNVFNSLRGFDAIKGSFSGTLGRKKGVRSSVSAVFNASTPTESHSSKESDKKHVTLPSTSRVSNEQTIKRSSGSSMTFQRLKSFENYEATDNTSDISVLDNETEEDSNMKDFSGVGCQTGSLDSLLMSAHSNPTQNWSTMSITVELPNKVCFDIAITDDTILLDIHEIVCKRSQLNKQDYFLKVVSIEDTINENDKDMNHVLHQAHLKDFARNYRLKKFQLMQKFLYSLQFNHSGIHGLTLNETGVVTKVDKRSKAWMYGMRQGDEIVILNGRLVADISTKEVERCLLKKSLRLLVRTCKKPLESEHLVLWSSIDQQNELEKTNNINKDHERRRHLMSVTEEYLQNIVVAPPPVVHRNIIQMSPIHKPNNNKILAVPPPDINNQYFPTYQLSDNPKKDISNMIKDLLNKMDSVSSFCRQLHIVGDDAPPKSSTGNEWNDKVSEHGSGQKLMTDQEKLEKVLLELGVTEKIYVKDLECLINRYIIPLLAEKYFNAKTIQRLLNNADNMLVFQKEFFKEISEKIETKDTSLDEKLLFVSTVFLRFSSRFKMYSAFCACHTEISSAIEEVKNQSVDFQEFLNARNPNNQHSSTLESYLIKPIQRILKYPLLLRELSSLASTLVSEKTCKRLQAAISAMNNVARHINDMQTVYDELGDEFGVIMQQAVSQADLSLEVLPSLDILNLICYAQLTWINPSEDIFKLKKVTDMDVLLFGFHEAVIFLCREVKHDKRKSQNYSESSLCFIHTMKPLHLTIKTKLQDDMLWQLIESDKTGKSNCFKFKSFDLESKSRTIYLLQCIIKSSLKAKNLPADSTDDQQKGETGQNVAAEKKKSKEKDKDEISDEYVNNLISPEKLFYSPTSPTSKSPFRSGIRRSSQINKSPTLPPSKWKNTTAIQHIKRLPINLPQNNSVKTNSDKTDKLSSNNSIFYIDNNITNHKDPENNLKSPALLEKFSKHYDEIDSMHKVNINTKYKETKTLPNRYNLVYGVQPYMNSVNK